MDTIISQLTVSAVVQKDFTITIDPSNLTIREESSRAVVVTLHSTGFNGTLDLSVNVSPSGQGLTARLVKLQVHLGFNETRRIPVLISSDDARAGTYTVTVTASGGTVSHTAMVRVTLVHHDDDENFLLHDWLRWVVLVLTARFD